MSEMERLGIERTVPRSIGGVGLTRTESSVFERLANPDELINDAVKTEGYAAMNDNEKKVTLQLIMDQFLEDAETKVFDTERAEFKPLRQRIRESQ